MLLIEREAFLSCTPNHAGGDVHGELRATGQDACEPRLYEHPPSGFLRYAAVVPTRRTVRRDARGREELLADTARELTTHEVRLSNSTQQRRSRGVPPAAELVHGAPGAGLKISTHAASGFLRGFKSQGGTLHTETQVSTAAHKRWWLGHY